MLPFRITAVATLLASVAIASAQLASTAWPKEFANKYNNSRGVASGAIPVQKWGIFNSSYLMYGGLSIGLDGNVFAYYQDSSSNNHLSSFSPATGALGYNVVTGTSTNSSGTPTIGADGTIYNVAGSVLSAYDGTSGAVKWSKSVGSNLTTPALDSSGHIFVGAFSTTYNCYNSADGSVAWTKTLDGSQYGAAAIDDNGTVYLTSHVGSVYALNPANGATIWHTSIGGGDNFSNSAVIDGTHVYAMGDFTGLYCFDKASGAIVWHKTGTSGPPPAIAPNGEIIAVDGSGNISGFNPDTGNTNWTINRFGEAYYTSPTVDSNGTIYVSAYNIASTRVIDGTTHQLLWSYYAGEVTNSSSPIIGSDGSLYVPEVFVQTNLISGLDTFSNATISLVNGSVVGGASTTATLTLPGTSFDTVTVKLRSQNPAYLGVPASVTIPAYTQSVTFPVTTQPYSSPYALNVNATYDGVNKSIPLTVTGTHVSSLTLGTNPIIGGHASVTATVTLAYPAPAGGYTVNLGTGNPTFVTVPTSITVLAGQTQAQFSVEAKAYPKPYSTTLSATDQFGKATTTLTVNPQS